MFVYRNADQTYTVSMPGPGDGAWYLSKEEGEEYLRRRRCPEEFIRSPREGFVMG